MYENGTKISIVMNNGGRIIEGTVIKRFPANKEVSDEDLLKYFNVSEYNHYYSELKRPNNYDRFCLADEEGIPSFVFPDNQKHFKIYVMEEDDHEI